MSDEQTKAAKPGIKTTELWLALAAMTVVVVLAITGRMDGDAVAAVMGLATAGYSASRGMAKK